MYLDTANTNEIKQALQSGVFKGVTTNPTLMRIEKKPRFQQVDEIMACNPNILFVQILGNTVEELIEDFYQVYMYAKNHSYNIGIKVPMHYDGLKVVKLIKQHDQNVKVLGTAIYAADQVILAALAGCDMVAPYINRMQNNGVDAYGQLHKMRSFIDARHLPCEILAASFKNTTQIVDALTHGAHTCTISFALAKAMMDKELAIAAIDVFNLDGQYIG